MAETLRHIEAFTEGFFLYDGVLYESSGRKDSSFVYRYSDGYRKDFDKVFLEGSVIWKDRMFLLTYRDHVAYVLDKETFEIIRQYPYPREGWGLTTDGEYLIASNGSDRLFYMDEEFNTVRTVEVRDAGRPVRNINELEYVEGYILANVWRENTILTIDCKTGEIVQKTDVRLKSRSKRRNVLNGIAYDGEYAYLTGKYFDEIWKVDAKIFLGEVGEGKQ